MVTMNELLKMMFQKNASDLHITAGSPPMLRIDGNIVSTELEKLNPELTQSLIYSILTDEQKERFERESELDVAFGISGYGRIRMNVFKQRGTIASSLRNIPTKIPSFEELGLPNVANNIVNLPKGLVLITGPTGSGKSTTLASMIDYINVHRKCHIVTIEDPIEFLHSHKGCIVNQREVGADTHSFGESLRRVLRQDPDVILIGEMRDLETINAALVVSETGHLVFATLHTTDSVQTINRIIDAFPPYQQPQVRAQLSFVIQAILAQQLLPKAYEGGRVLATEVLIPTMAIRNLIREEKIHQIYSSLQTGTEFGMQTMNQSLVDLYQKQLVTYNEIFSRTLDPKELERMIKGS